MFKKREKAKKVKHVDLLMFQKFKTKQDSDKIYRRINYQYIGFPNSEEFINENGNIYVRKTYFEKNQTVFIVD